MGRKSRAQIKDGILAGGQLGTFEYEVVAGVHRPDSRDDAPGGNVNVNESLQETRAVIFERLYATYRRIGLGPSHVKGFFLGLDPYVVYIDSGDAHFQMDAGLAGNGFYLHADRLALAYGRPGDVGYVHLPQEGGIDQLRDGIIIHGFSVRIQVRRRTP